MLIPEYGTDGRVGWWALPDQRFDCAVPPSSTSPAAAGSSDASPSESQSERRDQNCEAALTELPRMETVPCETGDRKFLRQYLRS